ncbi:MAG TPA: hypothetical protein VIV40_32025 [Kofleriaceae bacterium]
MKQWARRTTALRDELAQIADVSASRWWFVAGGAALDWNVRGTYLLSDSEPSADTFMGYAAPVPSDPLADAFARAHAARAALRELDGQLPDQPLAVTIKRTAQGAIRVPSALDVAAFAIGDRVFTHRLAARLEDETGAFVAAGATPFVTVTIGEEPIETARHGHRRGWITNGDACGPWLGLGRAGGLAIVSTCHMVVDGYGHARITGTVSTSETIARGFPEPKFQKLKPSPVAGAIPLDVAWRPLDGPAPRALQAAYALGHVLHELAGDRSAAFSPTFQIPVAPGEPGDPLRMRRRVVPAIASVRFANGVAEPFEIFAARTKQILAREAQGHGVAARLLSAARGLPMPLAWKRQAVGAERPGWLEPIADVIGGRGCVSKLRLAEPTPPLCAVSSPARLASESDELGSCVVTIIDDGTRAAITWCGSGRAGAPHLLDELLARLADA